MKKYISENIVVIISLINSVIILINTILSLVFDKAYSVTTIFLMIVAGSTLILLFFAVKRLKEKKDFIEFITFLFECGFNILPKICLMVENASVENKVHITEMKLDYNYRLVSPLEEIISAESEVKFEGEIHREIQISQDTIPDQYFYYNGNMYADNEPEVTAKYGTNPNYEIVNYPDGPEWSKISTECFKWILDKRYISMKGNLPIDIKSTYSETYTANGWTTIIFYPKQYGTQIDKVKFDIKYKHETSIIDKVELFKIGRNQKVYEKTAINMKSAYNGRVIEINPDSDEYEAYVFKVYWNLYK